MRNETVTDGCSVKWRAGRTLDRDLVALISPGVGGETL